MSDVTIEEMVREAASDIEGTIASSNSSAQTLTYSDLTKGAREQAVKRSRYLFYYHALVKQAIRLWTDYSFGSGISWTSDNEAIKTALDAFWTDPDNRSVLSAKGQRKSSDKVLVDGDVFFALFLGPDEVTIRWIDPLEITEIISDPDDIENVRFFKREWVTALTSGNAYYASAQNPDKTPVTVNGQTINATEEALVYHVALNTLGQRGTPLILSGIEWPDQITRAQAAHIAIVRALARFAWSAKTTGGASAVAAVKAVTEGKYPQAGSTSVTNQAVDLQPIKTDTSSADNMNDIRSLKLMFCAAVGIPEQYFGDLATGNLATAKTVELPMLKQFQSYQQVWADVYLDIFNLVLDHAGISPDNRVIDFDMPEITPSDAAVAIGAIAQLVTAFPQAADSEDVLKQALMNIGLNNVDEIIEKLDAIKAEQDKQDAERLAAMPPAMQNQAGQPPVPPKQQNPPPAPQPTGEPQQATESAEVRAIKALREIRERLG